MLIEKKEMKGNKMHNDVKTIILRFRDLATDDTIREHQEVINEKGYCYWGWWNKPQEKIPMELFSQLLIGLGSAPKTIYLFNSGSLKLYSVECTSIDYDPTGTEKQAKEIEAVPSYYRMSKCKCWFGFTKITEVEDAMTELQKYSYVTVGDFFEDTFQSREEAFNMYNDKIVFSETELAYQQRTMWFVREKRDTDKCNEILLYNAKNVSPSNFDDSFTQLKSNEFLWLSDLHFSDGDEHAYKKDEFQRVINSNLKKLEKVTPSEMILSGDYAYKATHEEFNAAKEAIFSIISEVGILKTNIAMCPGNHDFGFELEESGLAPIKKEYSANYSQFYKEIFQCTPNEEFCSVKRVITKNMIPIEIICINTLTMQQVQYDGTDGNRHKFIGMGKVGDTQLEQLHEKLKETDDKNCIRIMVMHHNLLPVLYSETAEFDKPYSGLLDAGRVMKFIFDNKIDPNYS